MVSLKCQMQLGYRRHSYSEIILRLAGDTLDAQKESMEGLMNAGISNITQHQLFLFTAQKLIQKKLEKMGFQNKV